MSTYDSYDSVEPRRHKSHRHHRDRDSEPRYQEVRETYVSGAPLAPEPPYPSSRTDLIRRPGREDSDLSIEEIQRPFPPPGGAYVASRSMVRDDRYGPPVRSRSADRGSQYGTYLGDPRDERRSRRKSVHKEEIIEPRRRSLSRNQKIIAGVAGAALAVGGKELWDRREASSHPGEKKDRNILGTAAIGAAGAFAGYEATELYSKKIANRDVVKKEKTVVSYKGRNGEEEYYSDSEEEKPKKSSRRKSIIEGALGLAGLGAAAKAASGGHDRDDRRRSRRGSSADSYTSRRSRGGKSSRGGESEGLGKIQQAAKAALLAGAAEAFRVRNEPGGWAGAKGKRILTAAIGAGGIDAAADRDPDHHSKRHVLEAVVGGLAGNRLVNGSRNKIEDDGRGGSRSGRSRSRSRAPSVGGGGGGAGLAALATAGLGALAGKKLLDRSRSRGGDDRDDRRRRYSSDEDDRDRGDKHKRSKSVSDYARKGLAALGIGEAAEAGRDRSRDRDDRRGSTREIEETHVVRKSRRRAASPSDSDSYDDRRDDRRGGGKSRGDPYGDDRYADSRSSLGRGDRRRKDKDNGRDRRVAEGKQAESDSDSLGSSSGDERRIKKMKGKQFLTTGLAAVATIHAAHNVYQSVEKRNARHKAVKEGEMTPEEAKKLKMKARLQDAASIGIAALGIKGAYSVSSHNLRFSLVLITKY
jgi:hypothetical protein